MRALSTLRRTLSLHFLLVAILPVLIFGLIAINLLHKYLQAGIYERNQLLSSEIADATDQFLVEVERDLSMAAKVLAADMIVRHEKADQHLAEIVRISGRFESIYLLDKDRHVISLGIDPRTQLDQGDYHNVDFSRHELLQKYPEIDRPVWSNTFVSLATGQPSVTLALPSRGGLLLGNVSLQILSQRLARYAPGSGESFAIVDHVGTLVASSDPDLAMQRVNFGFHQGIAQRLTNGAETRLERHGDDLLLESTASVPRAGWTIWVGSDMGKKMAPVDHIRNLLAGIMLLALVLAAGAALFDARRLMLPLSALSERAGEIGSGNYQISFRLFGVHRDR